MNKQKETLKTFPERCVSFSPPLPQHYGIPNGGGGGHQVAGGSWRYLPVLSVWKCLPYSNIGKILLFSGMMVLTVEE